MKTMHLCLLTLVCCACGTPTKSSAPKSDAIVRPEALPERHRAVLEAWKKGGAAWEIERDAVRADPELARFVVDNLMIEMVQAYDRSRLAKSGQTEGPFERAQRELVEMHEHSTGLLAQFLSVKDGVVGFLAADTLEKIGAPAVPGVVKVLGDEHDEARRRAAELLGKLPPVGKDEAGVMEALGARVEKDKAWIVRAQAARSLGARGSRAEHKGYALGVLVRALADEDASVGESAAIALGELGEPRGIPRIVDGLEQAAANGRPGVVEGLTKSLAKLSGDKRARDIAGWRAWWEQHQAAPANSPAPASNKTDPPRR